jgi:hypothetical protein
MGNRAIYRSRHSGSSGSLTRQGMQGHGEEPVVPGEVKMWAFPEPDEAVKVVQDAGGVHWHRDSCGFQGNLWHAPVGMPHDKLNYAYWTDLVFRAPIIDATGQVVWIHATEEDSHDEVDQARRVPDDGPGSPDLQR